MVKAEWGTKRTCPKCATRFYDLGNDEPVTCIECGTAFVPEPVLKSKQPMPFEAVEAKEKEKTDEDEEPSADDEVDLQTGEDDLGLQTGDDNEEEV